jgi:hypothetical protein
MSVLEWVNEVYPNIPTSSDTYSIPDDPNLLSKAFEKTMTPSRYDAFQSIKQQFNNRNSGVMNIQNDNNIGTKSDYDNSIENNSKNGLFECVIEPGEYLYFPSGWMHATLNLDSYNAFVSLFLDRQLMHGEDD